MQDEHIRSRIGQVEYLGELLLGWSIPIVQPVGDTLSSWTPKKYTLIFPKSQFPAQTLAANLYLNSGVRSMERGVVSAGRDPETGDHRYPKLELVRLTIPRRVYTQAHMDVVAEAVLAAYEKREEAVGLRWFTSRSICVSSRPASVRSLRYRDGRRRQRAGKGFRRHREAHYCAVPRVSGMRREE